MPFEPPNHDNIPGNKNTPYQVKISDKPDWSGSNQGYINGHNDHDWFKVYLYEGESYKFQDYSTSKVDTTLALWDGNGHRVKYSDGPGHHSSFTYAPNHSGYYYLDAGSQHDTTGSYSVYAYEQNPYDNAQPFKSYHD